MPARPGPRFALRFFLRSALDVAPALLGAYLVRRTDGDERLVGRLVEVEAYLGGGRDPGSHSHRGATPRNRAMFGPPGRLYVYRSYGIHTCANAVCEPEGSGAAVLFRAFEPIEGAATMRARRGLPADAAPRLIASGPGRLCQALGIGLEEDGRSLLRGPLELRRPGAGDPPVAIEVGPRIGLTKGADLPYRFAVRGSPWRSR